MRFDPRKRSVSLDSPRRSWDCTECGIGPKGRLARGDTGKHLPTFHEDGRPVFHRTS
jgi:hypothetical protein